MEKLEFLKNKYFKLILIAVAVIFVFTMYQTVKYEFEKSGYVLLGSDKCTVEKYVCDSAPNEVYKKGCTYGGDYKSTYYIKNKLKYEFYFDYGLSGFPCMEKGCEADRERNERESDKENLDRIERECRLK